MELKEKASYIIGLVDGLEPDFTTKEGRILKEVMQLLVSVCDEVTEVKADIEQIYEELDAIDSDLSDVENELFDGCGCGDDCACGDDEFDGGIYEVTCPECGEIICFDEDMLEQDDLVCAGCGTKLEPDFDFEEEE